ncbi:glycosyl hydrolase [Sporothrix brasiliensis 5110]|uniref:Glycosyl hydrolase n=1 Tax=Sporothrix brasiliensis 5110 TaxID=1398154 RepID=A0A0C2IPP2_9PEZI|nr:glycosyl hydrolase [Sporothrix brasiliensis 5110]KIH88905.1 glycosyl hydrolase [Sporothrix brasiliensis 5110]
MVHLSGAGSLATRALVFMSTHPFASRAADKAQYAANTASAVNTLQHQWYDDADGLWNSTGWWNSANLLTTLADFALDGAASDSEKAELEGVFANTFTNAQKVGQTAVKVVNAAGLVTSTYTKTASGPTFVIGDRGEPVKLAARDGFAGFINDFYDDEGWWALAWIRAFDVTGTAAYLAMAESIFADMKTGAQPASCGGGIWWSKDRSYKNAIANELYLAVAASLANRATSAADRASYLATAVAQWVWFKGSGMINSQGTINDGLTIQPDGSCVNNGQTAWSYNQGVVLGGLVELFRANGDPTLIPAAAAIANAAINALSEGGILHESCEANGGSCGGDGPTFKGVFLRNLHYLQQERTLDKSTARALKAYVLQNADSIWATDRVAGSNQLGLVWSGPPTAGGSPTAATHGAAMDCLVAAVAAA